MLSQPFDPERYRRIQAGAVATAADLAAVVDTEATALRNVCFLGAGGAAILMSPAASLLQSRSSLPVWRPRGSELVSQGSIHCGPGTLAVIPSLSGTTPDALDQLRWVQAQGARVLALVGRADSPIAAEADYAIANEAADDTSSESFYLQSLILALTLMHRRGEYQEWEHTLDELAVLPEALVAAKHAHPDKTAATARVIAEQEYHIFTGAGSSWPEASYFAMCILEEMQWIRTRPVHASDFFHGTLELVEDGVSVIVCKGEDPSRPLVERVESFAREHTDLVTVIDSAEVDLPGVSQRTRALISPVVLAAVLERVSVQVEALRDHPLTHRRYYRKVPY